jgi:hypothetical protein
MDVAYGFANISSDRVPNRGHKFGRAEWGADRAPFLAMTKRLGWPRVFSNYIRK